MGQFSVARFERNPITDIMTGKNILIEKSKVEMAAEDIEKMLVLIAMR